ncbi:MAG: hypothetical protein ACXWVJ_01550 [Caulobacteraceae bacterium]
MFLLRQGYSAKARWLSFGWLILVFAITIGGRGEQPNKAPVETPRPDRTDAERSAIAELDAAGTALYRARMAWPDREEDYPAYQAREAEAEKRYEAAQVAVNGPNWRAKVESDWKTVGEVTGKKFGYPAN